MRHLQYIFNSWGEGLLFDDRDLTIPQAIELHKSRHYDGYAAVEMTEDQMVELFVPCRIGIRPRRSSKMLYVKAFDAIGKESALLGVVIYNSSVYDKAEIARRTVLGDLMSDDPSAVYIPGRVWLKMRSRGKKWKQKE